MDTDEHGYEVTDSRRAEFYSAFFAARLSVMSRTTQVASACLKRAEARAPFQSVSIRVYPWFKNIMSRILIIEDEAPMRTALTDLLTAEGYRVLSAADGESGPATRARQKPDLILLRRS